MISQGIANSKDQSGGNIKKTIDILRQRLSISPNRALETIQKIGTSQALATSHSGMYKLEGTEEKSSTSGIMRTDRSYKQYATATATGSNIMANTSPDKRQVVHKDTSRKTSQGKTVTAANTISNSLVTSPPHKYLSNTKQIKNALLSPAGATGTGIRFGATEKAHLNTSQDMNTSITSNKNNRSLNIYNPGAISALKPSRDDSKEKTKLASGSKKGIVTSSMLKKPSILETIKSPKTSSRK